MRGRPTRGLIGGLLLGIFVDLDLALGGVVKLDSILLTILPVALLVIGFLLGVWAPVGRPRPKRSDPTPAFAAPTAAPVPTVEPPPAAASEPPAPAPLPTEDTPPI